MKILKKLFVLILICIVLFTAAHITPKLAIRTMLIKSFSGHTIPLVLSNIKEFQYKEEQNNPNVKVYIIDEKKSDSPMANHYKIGVEKKLFLYFVYPIGKA